MRAASNYCEFLFFMDYKKAKKHDTETGSGNGVYSWNIFDESLSFRRSTWTSDSGWWIPDYTGKLLQQRFTWTFGLSVSLKKSVFLHKIDAVNVILTPFNPPPGPNHIKLTKIFCIFKWKASAIKTHDNTFLITKQLTLSECHFILQFEFYYIIVTFQGLYSRVGTWDVFFHKPCQDSPQLQKSIESLFTNLE